MTYCIHQRDTETVVAIAGAEHERHGTLCAWPDNHPEKLVDGPSWLVVAVGGGQIVHPDVDCVNCPARATRPGGDQ
ncbi:hypothetical protein [Sagittula sp. S175]|uniref:hypothetical protein n=1 Tax=Sagittula sp. S175 TaxID=3415129 RepID=UPI003C7BE8D8